MKARHLLLLVCTVMLGALPARAYEGQENDFAACIQGQGKVDNQTVVKACTRLIDNAAEENEMVGFFYAMRAVANDDKALNCSDAKKVLELTDDPTFVEGAKTIMKTNC